MGKKYVEDQLGESKYFIIFSLKFEVSEFSVRGRAQGQKKNINEIGKKSIFRNRLLIKTELY